MSPSHQAGPAAGPAPAAQAGATPPAGDPAAHDFDLFVIGAGSGGVRAARIAAGYGARVAVAEESRYGGTCVIRGCVPKKLLVYGSRFAEDFADAAGFGWQVAPPRFDWSTLIANKDREITRLEGLYRGNLEKAGVTLFPERAVLVGSHRLRLTGSGREVTAARILIATGGRPVVPAGIEGADLAIVSDQAFDLPALPGRIVILGAGYIALEFACIFRGLGAEVTVVARGKGLLRGFDSELAAKLATAMQARGITLRLGSAPEAIARKGPGEALVVTLADGSRLEADEVMLATGRAPNTAGLGLEAAGLDVAPSSPIPVDAFSRTAVPHLFAVGDVTDRLALTPVAIREGHAFADTQFGDRPWVVDYEDVPTAVFTTPEMGTVGLTEEEAVQRHAVVDIYRADFRTMKATLSGSAERVFMKVLVDASSDRLLGVHLLGPDSGELVQVLATLLKVGATKADLDRTMPLHPSAAEELMTLRTRSERRFGPGTAADR